MTAAERQFFSDLNNELKKEISEFKKEMNNLSEKINNIEKREIGHANICPQNKELAETITDVKRLKEDLFEYQFFKKYPKAAAILFLVFTLGLIGSGVVVFNKAEKQIERIETIMGSHELTENGVNN